MDRFKRGSQGNRSSSAAPKADGRLPLSFSSEGPAPNSRSEPPVTPAFGPASGSSMTNRTPASSEPEQQARPGFFSSHFSTTSDESGPFSSVDTGTGGGGGGGSSISRTQTKMSAALIPQTATPSPRSGAASSSSLANDSGDTNTDQDYSLPSRSYFSSFPESSKLLPSVSSTAPHASSDARAATISSGPSKGGASNGKRRMLLDVDVQCGSDRTVAGRGGGQHSSISRGPVESSSPSSLQSPEPPTISGSTGKGKGKQRAPQQQPKKRAASQHSESGQHPAAQWSSGRGRAREGDESSTAGVRSSDGVLPRVEQNKRPSTTPGRPAPGRGRAEPAATTATATAATAAAGALKGNLGGGSSRCTPSSPSSPPLDAVMDDRDPFDDHVKAEEAASSSLAESTENVMKRQLAFREGLARAHSQLLQLDDGFKMLAQVDELLVDARALLKVMGIGPESAEQPVAMDEDHAGYQEESREVEQGSHDSLPLLVARDGNNDNNDGGDVAPSLSTGVVTHPPASAARVEGEDGGGGEGNNDMDIGTDAALSMASSTRVL